MSLFGDEPTDSGPTVGSPPGHPGGLFDDEPASGRNSSSLFDDNSGASSPWDMPTPRKQRSRSEMIRNLLPAEDVPESYVGAFDAVVGEDGRDGQVTAAGIAKLFAVARLGADAQARIMVLVAPGQGSDVLLSRNEFNVVLALIGLAQEGDVISLDGVDERRRSEWKHPYMQLLFALFLSHTGHEYTSLSLYRSIASSSLLQCQSIYLNSRPVSSAAIQSHSHQKRSETDWRSPPDLACPAATRLH